MTSAPPVETGHKSFRKDLKIPSKEFGLQISPACFIAAAARQTVGDHDGVDGSGGSTGDADDLQPLVG